MALLINKTKDWIEKVVIGLNLCPFAKVVFDKELINYKTVESENTDDQLVGFFEELKLLKKAGQKQIATSFLLYPNGVEDFQTFLKLFSQAEFVLEETKMNQTFQLAGFHPDYQFEGTEKEDIENATNQSPIPMIHILRLHQVTKAIETHPDVDAIPKDNIEKLKALGKEKFKDIWSVD